MLGTLEYLIKQTPPDAQEALRAMPLYQQLKQYTHLEDRARAKEQGN